MGAILCILSVFCGIKIPKKKKDSDEEEETVVAGDDIHNQLTGLSTQVGQAQTQTPSFAYVPPPAPEVVTVEPEVIIDSNMTMAEAMANLPVIDGQKCSEEILGQQTLVDVEYYSFDNKLHKGQIVVDKRLAGDIRDIFELIRDIKFPVDLCVPINKYDWSDDKSMRANNSSGFCYRRIANSKKMSNHASGFGIDINPRMNPYIKKEAGKTTIDPPNGTYDPSVPGTLTADHAVVKKFKSLGWKWGGEGWSSGNDYQHFDKKLT